jgi:hypothetical protein
LNRRPLRSRILFGAQDWASIQKTKIKRGSNAMLVQIGQNSATVTPFGSLGSANHSADGGGQSVGRRPNAIGAVWRWICHLFAAA